MHHGLEIPLSVKTPATGLPMKSEFAKQNRQLAVLKALANANRLKILKALLASPNNALHVSDLSRQLQLPAPKISDHLKLLRMHKLVKAKQNGPFMFYSIHDPIIYTLLANQMWR